MYKALLCCALGLLVLGCERLLPDQAASDPFPVLPVVYPETYRDSLALFTFHGDTLFDPFFWLALPETPAVTEWVQRQEAAAEAYLRRIPFRKSLERLMNNQPEDVRFSLPFTAGNSYYIFRKTEKDNLPALCRLADPYAEPVPVLRPDTFWNGAGARLGDFRFSTDGSLLAYEVALPDSPWRMIRVQDMETGRALPDVIRWVRYSRIAWHKDGFFYSRYDAPPAEDTARVSTEFHQVYFHRVGTDQRDDLLVFADPVYPHRRFSAFTTDDEQYLLLSANDDDTEGNALYIRDLADGILTSGFQSITDSTGYRLAYIGQARGRMLLLTDIDAPRGRLVLVSPRQPQRRYWEEIVPEGESTLAGAYLAGGRIFGVYNLEGKQAVQLWSTSGMPGDWLPLPQPGCITGIEAYPGTRSIFLGHSSLLLGDQLFEVDLRRNGMRPYRASRPWLDTARIGEEVVHYRNTAGEDRLMYLLYRRDQPQDTATRAVLYVGADPGTGPAPSVAESDRESVRLLLENGVLCALPMIGSRVPGDRGRWAPGAVNDVQAASEYLLSRRRTSSGKLGLWGSGEGSLFAAAAIVQRPDLFRALVCDGGPFDLIRYHLMAGGDAMISRYGSSDRPREYDRLLSYSPVHQVTAGNLPAVLVRPGYEGGGPAPAHAYKWVAALQEHQRGPLPVLLWPRAGADRLAFLLYQLQQAPQTPVD